MRKRTITAGVLGTLVTGSMVAAALAPTAAVAATSPTVTINTAGPYYDGQSVQVALSGFTPSSTVTLTQCSDKAATGNPLTDCDVSMAKQVTTDATGAATTTFNVLSVSYSDTDGNICDETAANACALGATDGTNQANSSDLSLLHGITADHLTGLTNGQKLTVKANGYEADAGTSNGQYVVECSAGVLTHITQATSYCDVGGVILGSANADGTVTNFTPSQLTVAAGNAWTQSGAKGLCDGTHSCLLVITDNISPTSEQEAFASSGYTPITFAKSIVTSTSTKTSLKPKSKTGKKGKKVSVTATTKPTKGEGKFTGKLVVTDNGKKVGSFKEPKNGVVKFKVKLAKGTNKIVAKYSGNKYFKKSTGTTKIKAKK